jgi:hypothetical protein
LAIIRAVAITRAYALRGERNNANKSDQHFNNSGECMDSALTAAAPTAERQSSRNMFLAS